MFLNVHLMFIHLLTINFVTVCMCVSMVVVVVGNKWEKIIPDKHSAMFLMSNKFQKQTAKNKTKQTNKQTNKKERKNNNKQTQKCNSDRFRHSWECLSKFQSFLANAQNFQAFPEMPEYMPQHAPSLSRAELRPTRVVLWMAPLLQNTKTHCLPTRYSHTGQTTVNKKSADSLCNPYKWHGPQTPLEMLKQIPQQFYDIYCAWI